MILGNQFRICRHFNPRPISDELNVGSILAGIPVLGHLAIKVPEKSVATEIRGDFLALGLAASFAAAFTPCAANIFSGVGEPTLVDPAKSSHSGSSEGSSFAPSVEGTRVPASLPSTVGMFYEGLCAKGASSKGTTLNGTCSKDISSNGTCSEGKHISSAGTLAVAARVPFDIPLKAHVPSTQECQSTYQELLYSHPPPLRKAILLQL
ncbi:hypothetical protein AXG93_550s1030 [Marchantia polymorpha subsp. ruderalis]|uniref:Uncharacterized protein n=1 Tax=Marchantia polymorpha subsp. ruderalis TaxID=1480154 RepID=A0A176WR91_MARPO|nr:hypothetical protein AXG93_550s1030 [Marchantia polymorpha subsp. ruderalis]